MDNRFFEDALAAVSAVFALNGWDHAPSMRIARRAGEKSYDVFVKDPAGAQVALRSVSPPIIRGSEIISDVFDATQYATRKILDGSWHPVQKEGIIGSAWHSVSPCEWERSGEKSKAVWRALVDSGAAAGRYAWCADLGRILRGPATKTAVKNATSIMLKAFRHRPDWEEKSGVNLLSLVSDDRWLNPLIRHGASLSRQSAPAPAPSIVENSVLMPTDALLKRILASEPHAVWRRPPNVLPASWVGKSILAEDSPIALFVFAFGNRAKAEALISAAPSLMHLKDGSGFGCLHAAASTGNQAVVELLVEKGADLSDTSATGHIPAEYVPDRMDDLFGLMEDLRLANPCKAKPL